MGPKAALGEPIPVATADYIRTSRISMAVVAILSSKLWKFTDWAAAHAAQRCVEVVAPG